MTFLSIMRAVAKNAGIAVPATTQGTSDDQIKLAQFINEAGAEIARRVDWGVLREIATITGTGSPDEFPIAAGGGFSRLARGACVVHDGEPVRGSLTADEWLMITPAEGVPRYFYLRGASISFHPYLENAAQARVQYQSDRWASQGGTPVDRMTLDDDEARVPGDLVEAGAVWRWRRHVGKDFADHMAEFEAMLADRAQFDGGVRSP